MHKSASDRDIRAAYKRLSKKWHPDKNKTPEAEGKFVDIARGMFGLVPWLGRAADFFIIAYEILSDTEVRQFYQR